MKEIDSYAHGEKMDIFLLSLQVRTQSTRLALMGLYVRTNEILGIPQIQYKSYLSSIIFLFCTVFFVAPCVPIGYRKI